jgi:hypothetical protein
VRLAAPAQQLVARRRPPRAPRTTRAFRRTSRASGATRRPVVRLGTPFTARVSPSREPRRQQSRRRRVGRPGCSAR